MSLKGKLALLFMGSKKKSILENELRTMGPGIAPKELKK